MFVTPCRRRVGMIRKGSLDGLAEEVGDPELLELALADYERGERRERSSRKDYVLGWVAAYRRLMGTVGGARNDQGASLTVAA